MAFWALHLDLVVGICCASTKFSRSLKERSNHSSWCFTFNQPHFHELLPWDFFCCVKKELKIGSGGSHIKFGVIVTMAAVMRPVLARIWIWFAVAALLGTATVFLGRKRKLQMEILFLVLPSPMWSREKTACRKDWQLKDAQGSTHVLWVWYQQG